MDLKKLGTIIRQKREEIGIPPSVLAEKTGIRRPTLWIYERGENPKTGRPSRPSKDKLERLAEVLHMSEVETEEFLSLADYMVVKQPPQASSSKVGITQQSASSSTTTITEVNGTVYLASDGYLYAFDAKTGDRLWFSPTIVSPFEAEIMRLGRRADASTSQHAIEMMQEDIIDDIHRHLSKIVRKEVTKQLDARYKEWQGARENASAQHHAPSRKAQKESAVR